MTLFTESCGHHIPHKPRLFHNILALEVEHDQKVFNHNPLFVPPPSYKRCNHYLVPPKLGIQFIHVSKFYGLLYNLSKLTVVL